MAWDGDEAADGGFLADIGVRRELTAAMVVEQLAAWGERGEDMAIGAARRAFRFLRDNWRADDEVAAKAAAGALPAIVFVPDREQASTFQPGERRGAPYFRVIEDKELSGAWLRPADCVWTDKTYLADSLRVVAGGLHVTHEMNRIATGAVRAAGDYYGAELEAFFHERLRVTQNPGPQHYIAILRRAARAFQEQPRDAAACVLRAMNHFVFEAREARDRAEEGEVDRLPLILALRAAAAHVAVPNAAHDGLTPLAAIRWIAADQGVREALAERGLGAVLRGTALTAFDDGRYGVAESGPGAPRGAILVKSLAETQAEFYSLVWRPAPLAPDCLRERWAAVLPDGIPTPPLRPAAAVPVCHIATQTLQRWSLAHLQDPAARDALRCRLQALEVGIVGGMVGV
jgi:hypothetical protein